MADKSIDELAEGFGLSVERIQIPGHENALKVYKGVNPIFTGAEEAVRTFLAGYDRSRPGLYEGSIYNYQE
jgi:hypothetical protein